MLRVESVSKDWKEFKLREITFDVEAGEYFIILGPSGAGKTVLLEIIAGIITPDSGGGVLLEGRDVTRLPPPRSAVWRTSLRTTPFFPT